VYIKPAFDMASLFRGGNPAPAPSPIPSAMGSQIGGMFGGFGGGAKLPMGPLPPTGGRDMAPGAHMGPGNAGLPVRPTTGFAPPPQARAYGARRKFAL
jgi:hypothetical protein